MQQTLITQQDSGDFSDPNKGYFTTFRECLKASEGRNLYHKKLVFLMAAYWIFASFFIALPFYLFKKPIYCQLISDSYSECCEEGDESCIDQVCLKYGNDILNHIKNIESQKSLTILFRFFCDDDWKRVAYKILPQILPVIGFLIYGTLADIKGRQVAMKISWRLFTLGLIIFCTSQARFLKTFGYVLASIHCFPSLIIQFVLFFQHNAQKQKNRQILLLIACLFIGPLVLSFFSQLITQIDNRIVLSVLCAFPILMLAMTVDKIHESAVCMYPFSKARAFGIINKIAKQNKKLPIMIDLSKSFWHKEIIPKINIVRIFKKRNLNVKVILGFFYMFVIVFNVKVSQVSLDFYTSTNFRSILVNVPTALADLTLCFVLLRIKHRTCRFMFMSIILLIISLLACKQMDWSDDTIRILAILHAVGIRYLSQLCYGLVLIWSIETFPTICRGICVGFVFCGSSLGCLLVYLLREYIEVAYIISLVSTTFAVVFQGFMDMHKSGVMKDTLNDEYYDENDCFYRT